jgi:hypothetical protein
VEPSHHLILLGSALVLLSIFAGVFSARFGAIAVEPTMLTAAISGCRNSASTASLSPLTTLKTPGGRPASVSNSAILKPGEGSRSDGFSTKVLPQASATGNIHIGTIAGKLNGATQTQTPSGTDCGLGTRVGHPSICWAKFEAMAEGARRASKILWSRVS